MQGLESRLNRVGGYRCDETKRTYQQMKNRGENRSEKVRPKLNALVDQAEQLQQQAGIFDKAEALREREALIPAKLYQQELRELYFGVANRGLCKKLIAIDRQQQNLAREWWSAYLREAQEELDAALGKSPSWTLAAILGIFWVAVGYQVFGLVGAVAGAVVGIFFGLEFKERSQRDIVKSVKAAREEVAEIKATVQEIEREKHTFTELEAENGERDPNYRPR